MASTYVNNLRLEEIGTGEQSGTWGDTTNTNLEIIGQAVAWGTRAIANASTDNITIADGALDADRCLGLKLTGGGQACTITLLPNTSSKTWFMYNATAAALTFTCGSGANVIIPAGQTKVIATDGLGPGGVVHDLLTAVNLAGTTQTAAVTTQGTLTVGVDDTGYDVKFFGATSGKSLLWDESADSLIVTGTTTLVGTTNLDAVDIDGAVQIDAALSVGVNDTGYDVKFFGDTSGAFALWDASADDLILGGAAGLSVNSTALVTGVLTTTAATVFNGGFAANAGSTITTSSTDTPLSLVYTGAAANVGPVLDLYRNSASPADNDALGKIIFNGRNDNSQDVTYGLIEAYLIDASDGTEDAEITIRSMVAGTSTNRIDILPTEIVFNQSSFDLDFRIETDGNTHTFFVDGGTDLIGIGGVSVPDGQFTIPSTNSDTPRIRFQHPSVTGDASIDTFQDGGGTYLAIGSNHFFASNGASTKFNTSEEANMWYFDPSGAIVGYTATSSSGFDERMRIQSTAGKNLRVADGIDLTNGNLIVAAGHGIDFSAQTATATGTTTAELLNHYETGTFTPLFSGAKPGGGDVTYGVQLGFYTRIGNLVEFTLCIAANGSTIQTQGNGVIIVGLPFTNISDPGAGQNFPAVTTWPQAGLNNTSFTQGYGALVQDNTSQIAVYGFISTAGTNYAALQYNQLATADAANNVMIRMTGTYRTSV